MRQATSSAAYARRTNGNINAASLLLLENYKLRHPMVDQHDFVQRPPPPDEDLLLSALGAPQRSTRDFLSSVLLNPYEQVETPSPLISALARFGATKLVEQQLKPAPPQTEHARLRNNINRAAIGSQAHGPAGANVFVFHIPNEWDEIDLAVLFAQYGTILSARIATDKTSGRRLGFGFVSFIKVSDACAAVQALNGFSVAGKRLKVTVKRGEQHIAAQYAPHLNFSDDSARQPENPDPLLTAAVPPPAEPWSKPDENNQSQPEASVGGGSQSTTQNASGSVSGQGSTSNPTTTERTPTDTSLGGRTDCTTSSQRARHSDGGAAGKRRRRRRKARVTGESSVGQEVDRKVTEDTKMDIQLVFEKVLKRITADPPPEDSEDDNWLELLTALLRAPQGRRFMFTLLQAAGLVYGPATAE